jgi:hypothetical protein
MSDLQRQQINALSVVSWQTTDIETLERKLARGCLPSSDMTDVIKSKKRVREAEVRFLAQTGIEHLILPAAPVAPDFIDEVSRTWPLPLPELLDRARRRQVSNPYFALAVAASVANNLLEDCPDGSEIAAALVDFAEDVGEKFRSINASP